MKIVHVIIGLDVGGAELMLKRFVELSNGHEDVEHVVISLTGQGSLGQQLENHGVVVHWLDMKSFLSVPAVFLKLRKLIFILQPDVVQTWMYHSDFIGGLAAKSLGIKEIYWNVRNTKLTGRGFGNFLFRKICALFSHLIPKKIVYVSISAKRAHISAGYSIKKAVVINNGFDLDVFSYRHIDRLRLRGEWGIGDDGFIVCSVGRYADAKDHLTFIRALKLVIEGGHNVFAVIAGRGIAENKLLREEIGPLSDRFVLIGPRDDVPSILSACDMFCLHSITEGFPNVLGEAMSVGLPCATTRAGDAEIILNNKNFTCDVGDHIAMSNMIINVLGLSSEQRHELGLRNRERMLNEYGLKATVDRYLNLYRF